MELLQKKNILAGIDVSFLLICQKVCIVFLRWVMLEQNFLLVVGAHSCERVADDLGED